MGRVIIACAHGGDSDGGNFGEGTTVRGIGHIDSEYEISLIQSKHIAEELIRRGHIAEVFDTAGMTSQQYLIEVPRYINTTGPWSLAICPHHNSVGYQVKQHGLVIYCVDSTPGARAAQYVARELSDALPWAVRPASHLAYPRSQWFVCGTKFPAIMPEAGFFQIGGKNAPMAAEWYGNADKVRLEAEAIARGAHFFMEANHG